VHDDADSAAASLTEPADSSPLRAEIAREQTYVTSVYERLDEVRALAATDLTELRLAPVRGNTHQWRSERDLRTAMLEDRLAQLEGVEQGLCFGRLDNAAGDRIYVGRIGLSTRDYERLLVDWRAPAARPFYSATPGSTDGVARRRHLRTRDRLVIGIEDDVLDLDALPEGDRRQLAGEGALLAALSAGRTGRMQDIVATIQAEQDAVIRSELAGVLVVDGGPGTGKTAVALHRAAYLLYEHRDRLASDGVLVVGPNPVFLRYIERVLPSLGETGVVLSTLGGLVSGVKPVADEADEVAAVKGDLRMAAVLAAAVRAHQTVAREPVVIRYGRVSVPLEPAVFSAARAKARRMHRPHNRARATYLREVIDTLARRILQALAHSGAGTMIDPEDLADVISELRETEDVMITLGAHWPSLTPKELVGGLLGDARTLRREARALEPAERELLFRKEPTDWTPADLPLLDEAAELLGEVSARDPMERIREAERAAEDAYAAEAIAELDLLMPVDPSVVAARYRGTPRRMSTAERASSDRTWTYGHVVVDEAQELSPMAWRMIARRCPRRSMTVVGDLAQSSAPGAPPDWADILDVIAPGRWRRERLTVSYRTPAEIMAVAADVLSVADPAARVPDAIRTFGEEPWALGCAPEDLIVTVASAVRAEQGRYAGDGLVGVVVPDQLAESVAAALGVPRTLGRAPDLESAASVLTVSEVKGLEFDTVLVVEPAALVEARQRGYHDLYVAVTRATKRLGCVHSRPLPPGLQRLVSR
jgi:DNA helicase IV